MKGFSTKCIHIGKCEEGIVSPHVVPIYQTVNFDYRSAEEADSILTEKKKGYIYSRYRNPTVDALCEKVRAIEEGEGCLAFASGMAAISSSMVSAIKTGDHVVASHKIYGGTHEFLTTHLNRMGIEVSFIDTTRVGNITDVIKKNTKIIYVEPLSNPTLDVTDIKAIGKISKEEGLLLVVDNTFTPPPLFYPLKVGADVCIHSATKYLSGHGDIVGGIVTGKGAFMKSLEGTMRHYGGTLTPFSAWLALRGIKTLALRMERHCSNAMSLALFLESHPKVLRVYYPGLASHPQHALARNMFSAYGGMLSFTLSDGVQAARRMMDAMRLCKITVSLGDVETLVTFPSVSSHSGLSSEERKKAGIEEGLVRVSVGIEDAEDIIDDFAQALKQA
jgi:methionine-gamma-lyase